MAGRTRSTVGERRQRRQVQGRYQQTGGPRFGEEFHAPSGLALGGVPASVGVILFWFGHADADQLRHAVSKDALEVAQRAGLTLRRHPSRGNGRTVIALRVHCVPLMVGNERWQEENATRTACSAHDAPPPRPPRQGESSAGRGWRAPSTRPSGALGAAQRVHASPRSQQRTRCWRPSRSLAHLAI